MPTKQKVALVHDWLNGYRGGERVLEQLCLMYPEADIYTLFYEPGAVCETIEKHRIFPSFLNRLPKVRHYYRYLLPFYPMGIERFSLKGYDLILSTSHCVAKGIIPPPDATHICYCFTPVRYAWDRYEDYFYGSKSEFLFLPLIHRLRNWDTMSSMRVDHFVGISNWVVKRIEKYYRREARMVYPPVDVDFFRPSSKEKKNYYLLASAFAPYKRMDLAIEACNRLGKKLLVVGGGQDDSRLRRIAGDNVHFLGRVSGEKLRTLLSEAKALLFPGEEDFGITPLEANACGTPVIAYQRGGATETLVSNETALFFKDQNVDSLCEAIMKFENASQSLTPENCRNNAVGFNEKRFRNEMRLLIAELLDPVSRHRKEKSTRRWEEPSDEAIL